MKIFLGADHRGFELKQKIKKWLKEWKIDYEDMGNIKLDPVDDFVDYAEKVSQKVQEGLGEGILICGSGSMAMVANKFKGIRAALVWNKATTEHVKDHHNANILSLPANFIKSEEAREVIKIWLKTKFLNEERLIRRINKIKQIEERNFI
ncbi:MAG: RpiB/LacA/LacB family sugar-phosphate isomerase [Patescibacteria group bacterium]|nr:RpiB/LacA/LacB family sugar-phosphate isomerase [Patescibacteria group bacterium]